MKQITQVAALILVSLTGLVLSPARAWAADSLQLGSNEALFSVMAAINAAGYDEGVALPDNSPLRAQLREYLAKQHIAVLPELQRFYKRHLKRNGVQDLSQYVSWALSVNGPPEFAWRVRDVEVPPDALELAGLQELMVQFQQQANLSELWTRSQPAYEAEIEKYHAGLIKLTGSVDGYLRVPANGYLGRRFQVVVDLLAAPEQVQTRNYGEDAFVIVTASPQPRLFDIRHAYLHFEVDPIVIKYGMELQQKRSLIDFAQNAPMEDQYKQDYTLLANECLIKAIETRLDKNTIGIQQAAQQGFILTPFFAEQLQIFEKQQQGMRYYLEDMIGAMDLRHESTRIASIKFDASQAQRVAKKVVTEKEPELSAAGRTLQEADDLYAKRTLDDAKALYLKALGQSGAPAEHAQAWYGLAKIAILQNQPDEALKFFDKVLAGSPDGQTKAWTYVYLARLAKAAGEPDRAGRFYQEALAVPDASAGARDAAQKESGVAGTHAQPQKVQ